MSSSTLRMACASAGSLLLALAALSIRSTGPTRLALLPISIGILMLVPAAFGETREHVEAAYARFRNAAFVCFGAAIAVLVFVMALPDRHGTLAQRAAALGAACWLVAMMMTFCFAFYASKRRAIN